MTTPSELMGRIMSDPLVEAVHVFVDQPWRSLCPAVTVDYRRPLGADGPASFQRAVDICRDIGIIRLIFTQPKPGRGGRFCQEVKLTSPEMKLLSSGST